jgi:hypothetical protein
MPQLGSPNTVQRAPTGGAGAKPLIGSANTVWCWITLGLDLVRLCIGQVGFIRLGLVRLGLLRFGLVKLGLVRLGLVSLGKVRVSLGLVRLGHVGQDFMGPK